MPQLGLGLALGRGSKRLRGRTPNLNKTYTQLVGAPPSIMTAAWFTWYFNLLAQRRANVPSARATTYYYSTSGDDSNPGTQALPFATLSKLNSMIGANTRHRFKCGDTWRQTTAVSVAANSVTIDSYGSGAKPLWTGFTLQYALSAWTLDTGTTYKLTEATEVAWLRNADATLCIAPASALQRVADAATCRLTSGSFTWASNTLYINLGGTNPNISTWEATAGYTANGVNLQGDNIRFQGIRIDGLGMRNNADATRQTYGIVHNATSATAECVVENVEDYYGGYHSFGSLLGGITTFINCTAGLNRQGNGGTMFVTHAEAGGQEAIFHNPTTHSGNLWENGTQRNSQSLYGHTDGVGSHYIGLVIAYGITHAPGIMSCNQSAGFANTVPTVTDITALRGFIVGETVDDDVYPVTVTGLPSNQIHVNSFYRTVCEAGGQLSIGGTGSGWAINTFYTAYKASGYGSLFSLVSNAGQFINSWLELRGFGAIFSKQIDAIGWTLQRLKNCIIVCNNPGSATPVEATIPNVDTATIYAHNNAWFSPSPVVGSDTNAMLAASAGIGAISDPNKVILTTKPTILAIPSTSSPLYNIGSYYLQPEYDYYGYLRGTNTTAGPIGSGYEAGTVPTVPAAASFIFTTQPTSIQQNAVITPAVVVKVLDSLSEFVTTYTGAVTMSLNTNPGKSALSGTASVSAVAGVATFSDLTLDMVGTGYKLQAASVTPPALTTAVSSAFNVTAAWTPADIGAAVKGFWEKDQWFTDTGCTSKASAGQTVKGWKATVGSNATDSTGVPLFSNGMGGSASSQLTLASPMAALTNFTIYMVINHPSVTEPCIALGEKNAGGKSFVGYDTGSFVAFVDSGNGGFTTPSITGEVLVRFDRTSTVFNVTATGVARVAMTGTDGNNLTPTHIGAGGYGLQSHVNSRIKMILAVAGNIVGTQEDTDTLAWILANYGVSL